ncbi:MAG: putative addiction module antidote protein [Thiopseudomonas sp.]|nr:putative addiction module antidote protein [Thiopseudomonas sp.]
MQTINVNPQILKELGVQPFDVADYLQTDEDIVEYLSQVLSEGDTDELVRAIGYVAKARGMSQIAKDSGLGRTSLYKSFALGAQPRFETVVKVMCAGGLELQATPSTLASVRSSKAVCKIEMKTVDPSEGVY